MTAKSLRDLLEEQFDADSIQLPVFNRVALELQRLKESPSATVDRIAALIMKDQSLSSRILRIANSSFYGGLKKVDTVSRAVTRLGMERVTQLAMVASQLLAHTSRVRLVAGYMPDLWQHAYACALGARWVAEQSGYGARAEEAFLAALLHDIGELFILKSLEKLSQDKDTPVQLSDALVREVLDAMHAELGHRLMLKWELPEQYARVARDHHEQEVDENDVLLAITRLLDTACQKLGIGGPADPDIVLAATAEARALGLKEIKLAQLEVLLEDAVAEAKALV